MANQQTRTLPPELREHCVILVEERMYTQALSILQSLVTPSNRKPAIADAPLMSLISTLTVHPSVTSRAPASEDLLASSQALSYLSSITTRYSESTADIFASAFQFKRAQGALDYTALPAHGNKRRKTTSPIDLTHSSSPSTSENASISSTPSSAEGNISLNNALAGPNSVFSAAEGFWHAVGWAFNCSIRYPQRWTYWRNWLRVMVGILSAELQNGSSSTNRCQPSLGRQYLQEVEPSTRAGLRKVLRAIFADGSESSITEFHEVWRGETAPPKAKGPQGLGRSRQKLNLDEGKYGDYWDDEDIESETQLGLDIKHEDKGSSKRTSGRTLHNPGQYHVNMDLNHNLERKSDSSAPITAFPSGDSISAFGGIDSLDLRRKMLGWVAAYLRLHPVPNTGLPTVLDLTAELIRPLSVPAFSRFIAPGSVEASNDDTLNDVTLSRLHMATLNVLLSTDEVPVYMDELPTQYQLQRFYLPHVTKTNNIDDLMKTSITIEALIRIVKRQKLLTPNTELQDATERGIKARAEKAGNIYRRSKNKSAFEQVGKLLQDANTRLYWLVSSNQHAS